jgi:hypothetical protein
VLSEDLGTAEASGFDGFGGGEFAVDVWFGARGTGMERAALAGDGATGGTGYGRKLGWGEVFHSHEISMRYAVQENCSLWNSIAKKALSGKEACEKPAFAKATGAAHPFTDQT